MKIRLNGEEQELGDQTTVAELLESGGFLPSRVALLVNGDIVPKSGFATHVLTEGDEVEVVSFVGGG